MGRYLARRLLESATTLVLATIVIFLGVRALPGDPALAMAGEERDPATLAAIRAKLGLDQPLVVQYGKFVVNTFQGDLGNSTRTGQPVTKMFSTAIPVTLQLALMAILLAVVLGVLAGVVASVFQGRFVEWVANIFALFGLSIPNFWLGTLAILYLAVALHWFPASGYVSLFDDPVKALHHLTLPAVVLGVQLSAVIMRQTRSSMLENLSTDFVRTARAKGLSAPKVIFGHALRNSLIVVVTIIGLQLGGLISGAVVTESIFALPGFGKMTIDAVFQRDYPVVQAVVLVTATAYIVINLIVDMLYSVIDPRIRVAGVSS